MIKENLVLLNGQTTKRNQINMYTLIDPIYELEAGTTLYDFKGHDYGVSREDTLATGEPHQAVTEDPKGLLTPFYSIPTYLLD